MNLKDSLSIFYYMIGAVAFVLAAIKVLYNWFREYDNSNRFTEDMARVHLPYINDSLARLAEKLGVDLAPCPPINFSGSKHQA